MPSKDEVKSFDLSFKTIPFKLVDEDGNEGDYYLQELGGRQRDAYLDNLGKRVEGSGDNTKLKDFEGIQAALLCRTLFKCDKDGKGTPVSTNDIQDFPARVQSELFDMSRKLSKVAEDEDEDKGGNDPPASGCCGTK